MEHLKKIIIIVLIIILLITVLLLLMKYTDKKDKADNFENTLIMEVSNTISALENRNEFFAVKSCITKYLSYIVQQDSEVLYSFLDKNYIEAYNITEQNVFTDLEKYSDPVFYCDKIYMIQDTTEVYTYFVYGKIIDKQTSKIEEFKIIIRLDKEKDLFSVIPYKYIEDNNYKIELGSTINFKYNIIEDKQYNKFAFKNITDQELVIFYMNEIKDNIIYDIESSYNKLDETYRVKRFSNLNKYKEYINKNIVDIYSAKLQKYQIKEYDGYTQYICLDENDNYYIINEINPGQYSVILDTYTIDLPEYKEKYNKANEQQKVAYCINRFVQAINDENYTFAYSLLANSFKNNYFKTQNSFENYAKQNLLGKEKVTYKEFKNEGNIYCTYSVNLENKEDNANSIEKTFIIKLGEGTNFELSFNVD